MVKRGSTIALEADPNDPEDRAVTVDAVEQALAERRERRRLRGAQAAQHKVPISIRLDSDIVEHFRATGTGWQGRMNDALRKAIA